MLLYGKLCWHEYTCNIKKNFLTELDKHWGLFIIKLYISFKPLKYWNTSDQLRLIWYCNSTNDMYRRVRQWKLCLIKIMDQINNGRALSLNTGNNMADTPKAYAHCSRWVESRWTSMAFVQLLAIHKILRFAWCENDFCGAWVFSISVDMTTLSIVIQF